MIVVADALPGVPLLENAARSGQFYHTKSIHHHLIVDDRG